MKGIILAGGKGTRLLPMTKVTNKHLIPVLNNPMVLYPIETLFELGIRDILIVTGGNHIGDFAEFLGDGSEYGVSLTYRVQREAGGIAQALGLAKDFAQGEPVAVILGDNIFDNRGPAEAMKEYAGGAFDKAHLFTKVVEDPNRFGVLVRHGATEEEPLRNKIEIIEKPKYEVSKEAVTGLYIYPAEVFDIIPTLAPSARGELEITDVNNAFIERDKCIAHNIGESFWSDAGTPESLLAVTKWAYDRSR